MIESYTLVTVEKPHQKAPAGPQRMRYPTQFALPALGNDVN